jgi:hypothetical protein
MRNRSPRLLREDYGALRLMAFAEKGIQGAFETGSYPGGTGVGMYQPLHGRKDAHVAALGRSGKR